jgi:outer membrane receptor protein involved in Fe transport
MTCAGRRAARAFVSFAAVAAVLLVLTPPLAAQGPATTEEPSPQQTEEERQAISQAEEEGFVRLAEEVSVTGSLIPRKDLESLSPVAVVNPEEITYQGTGRLEDLIQALPQVFPGQNSTIANGASGTATVDLRYLGAERTLALINGRRTGSDGTSHDLNFIPSALVQRVDILTGGASSVYGADAVAGVVNFVLDTEFEGVRGTVQYNAFQHNNNNATARAMNAAAGFPVPTGSTWDGGSFNANLAVGGRFAENRGHATAYVDYRNIAEILKERRDYTNCSPRRGDDGPVCGGSGATAQARFISFDRYWNYQGDYLLDPSTGNTLKPYEEEHFNYGPYNHMQRPDRKWSGGAFARYTLNRHFEPYAEIMFMDDSTDAEIAPTANFGNTEVLNCANPMLSPQQRDLLCTQAGFGPNDYANVITTRRNVEGGPRTSQLRHTSIRFLGGLRGDVSPAWSYDVYGLHASVSAPESFINDFAVDRIGYAMDVVGDPNDPSTWRCRSDDPGCVPWNIFRAGGVTQDAIDYMSVVALMDSGTRTQMLNLTVRGDLEGYGVALPSASEGVQLALGTEYRRERLYAYPDEVFEQGAAGFGSEIPGVDGSFSVRELFVEALVPVIQDTRGSEDLTLELGYRYADYDLSGGNSSYKGLLSWAPTSSLKLRAGFNRAVRAPNVRDLFNPQAEGAGWTDDFCANDPATGVPSATLEECLRTGLSESQYGNLPGVGLGGVTGLYGGNPDLDVETADTLTVGLVWTPNAITGLSATIDYYDIRLEDTIGFLWPEDILRQCADTGDPLICDLIHRDSAGTLWLYGGYVDSRDQNIGRSGARGVDLSASYPLNLGGRGFINLSLLGTYVLENSLDNGVADYDCVGLFGNQCWQPLARWRHRVRASWQTSFNTTISLGWRFIGSTLNDDASDKPHLAEPDLVESWRINGAYELPAYNFFDLAATYSFRDGLRLTLGVNNILDKEPQIAPGVESNDYGTGFFGDYDPLGRNLYASLQFEF